MKECDAKEYDVATYALAELMKQTVGGRENADELGFRWSNVEDAKRILYGIEVKLSMGADPNPIPGKSLLAVLCAFPWEGSDVLLRTIRAAVALGADTKIPLTKAVPLLDRSVMETNRHEFCVKADCQEVSSFAAPLFTAARNRELPVEEIRKRLFAVLSIDEDRISQRRLEDMFMPRPTGGGDYSIVRPLLCGCSDRRYFDILLSLLEKYIDRTRVSVIVNDYVALFHKGKEMSKDNAFRWLAGRVGPDSLLWGDIGNTPLHTCIRDLGVGLGETVQRLRNNGAMSTPWTRNLYELTPYGMACACGKLDALASEFSNPEDRANEFADLSRDCMDRLLLTHVLHDCLSSISKKLCDHARRLLSEYLRCESIPAEIRSEMTAVFSDTLARIVSRDAPSRFQKGLIAPLLEAGADPCYALPGMLPTWKKAVLTYGIDAPELREILCRTPALSDADMRWVEKRGIIDMHAVPDPAPNVETEELLLFEEEPPEVSR